METVEFEVFAERTALINVGLQSWLAGARVSGYGRAEHTWSPPCERVGLDARASHGAGVLGAASTSLERERRLVAGPAHGAVLEAHSVLTRPGRGP